MDTNEQIKNECINICKKYNINIDFNNENWQNEFINRINWYDVSRYQTLSENFIEKFQDKVDWENVSIYQKLSEDFIEKFQDKVRWYYISYRQNLSEDFIEKFQDRVHWYCISSSQKLSENFIEKFQDRIIWCNILGSQILSENFIAKYINKFDKNMIDKVQRISREFAKKHNIKISRYNWYQKSYKWKLKFIKENTNYEILNDDGGDYIIAYKSIRPDNKSFHDPNSYEYIVGNNYESNCDYDILNRDSHGLAAWDEENAVKFGEIDFWGIRKFKLIKVKIYISDIGAIIKDNKNKIRCFKFQVIEDLGVYEYGNK